MTFKRTMIFLAVLTVLLVVSFLLAHLPTWAWHPLIGRGYQLWSGIASDVSEITFPIELITAAVAIHQFLHAHFECHEESCEHLGFHQVPRTSYRTCWEHHPVLGEHLKHGVPFEVIRQRHEDAHKLSVEPKT